MTQRERVMAVLEGKKPDRVPWFPDITRWYLNGENNQTLPDEYKEIDIFDFYRKLGAGIQRGTNFYRCEYSKDIEIGRDL